MRDYVLPDYTHIKRGFIRPLEETTGKAKGSEQVCEILYNIVMRDYVLPDYKAGVYLYPYKVEVYMTIGRNNRES